MTICIIPARSGSKRLKDKNIKKFHGKPIISYAIKLAKSSGLFSKIIVSTDSKKISNIAKSFGADVPFFRSKKLSDDYTPTSEVLIDCIKKISSEKTKFHFCLYPTTTLISKMDLVNAFNKIIKKKANLLIAITDFETSPYRALKITNDNVKFYFKKYAKYRSQDVPKLYRDSGSFYIFKTDSLLRKENNNRKDNLSNKSTYYYLDRNKAVDIDNINDFKLAELLFKRKIKF
jgi:pseudaminic acid cytidylyltransferase|tara:strand:- start:2364 stop:3059 length:696 start_codon:yes stop_codon:yes gene_type:complete